MARLRNAILVVLALGACGDDDKVSKDAAVETDATSDVSSDASGDATEDGIDVADTEVTPRLTSCLEQPGLARPPGATLPCELIPPGGLQ